MPRMYRLVHHRVTFNEQGDSISICCVWRSGRVLARCRELGIRDEFAPQITRPFWFSRGQNSVKARVEELRKLAKTRIDADLKALLLTAVERDAERRYQSIEEMYGALATYLESIWPGRSWA